MFLDRIVGEMYCGVINILRIDAIFRAASPNIPFSEEVQVAVLVVEDPYSDVEFSVTNKKRPFDVFLNDERVMFYLESSRGRVVGALFLRRPRRGVVLGIQLVLMQNRADVVSV